MSASVRAHVARSCSCNATASQQQLQRDCFAVSEHLCLFGAIYMTSINLSPQSRHIQL